MRAAGDAGGVGDPAGVAAHDFNDDHAVVRVGGGVDAVDGLGGDHDRGVEAEGLVGAADVVVDGLGNADGLDAVLAQEERDRLRVVAAEGDERVDLVGLENLLHLLDAAGNLLHVGARGVQDGAALELNAVGVFESERNEVVVEHAAPAVQKADELVAVVVDSLSHRRINDRIQSGAIAAAGQQSNSHRGISSKSVRTARSSQFAMHSGQYRPDGWKIAGLTPYTVYRGAVKGNRDRRYRDMKQGISAAVNGNCDARSRRSVGTSIQWSVFSDAPDASIRYAWKLALRFLLAFVGLVVVVLLVLLQLTRLGYLIRATIPDRPRQRMFIASVSFLITFAGVRLLVHRIANHEGHLQWVVVRGMHIHHLVWGILILLLVGYGWLLDLGWSHSPMSIFFGRLMAVSYGVGAALTLDEFALVAEPGARRLLDARGPAEHRRGDSISEQCWRWARGARRFSGRCSGCGSRRKVGARRDRPAQLADSPRAVASSA